MASLLIRNVDDALRDQLKARARRHRRSLEEEARELLRTAVARDTASGESLNAIAVRLFGEDQGIDLDLPSRGVETDRSPLFDGTGR